MNIFTIVFRTIFYYFLVLFLFRLMGKREVGELAITDLVVTILIAEFASLAIENYKESLFTTLIPIILIAILQISLSFISMKNFKFRHIVDSTPSLIIKDGKINFKEMERQRYSIDDLLTQIRDKGIKSLDEIEYAVLENNGNLSTFLYDNKKIYPGYHMNKKSWITMNLDNTVNINDINKNKIWLTKILKEEKTNLDNVFYAFYKNNKCFIIKRND